MKQTANIFIRNKHAIIWTVCYIFAIKFILKFLFNFDMFSADAWKYLMHAHLHGFGGFVFGILVLAALPLYVATTTIIARTKKPLFTIPIPGFIKRAFAPPPPPPTDETTAIEKSEKQDPAPETFPTGMPNELRGAFIRVRRGGGMRPQASAFDNCYILNASEPKSETTPVNATQNTVTDTADDFPLPTNFDFTDSTDTDITSFPSFTDITFDAPSAPPTEPATPAPTPPTEHTDASNAKTSPILQKLSGARPDGEFIIYKDKLIVTHDDPDFWIADDIDWFASGKQRPNPTIVLKQRAADTGLTPVLYLAETNILDLDGRRAQWQSEGITVITNLDDL